MNQIRPLCLEDIPRVVEIHMSAFPQAALSALGNEAIRRYYHWLSTGPHDVLLLGAWMDDLLVGFSFGGVFRGALSGFIHKNKWYLFGQVVTRPWVLFKFQDAISTSLGILRVKRFHKSSYLAVAHPSTSTEVPSFGILAIAVNPQHQGHGFGQMMMDESEQFAIENSFKMMHLTVHPGNMQAVDFYENLGWLRSPEDDSWKGKIIKQL